MYRRLMNVLVAALCLAPALAADVDGKWTATFETPRGDIKITWELKAARS